MKNNLPTFFITVYNGSESLFGNGFELRDLLRCGHHIHEIRHGIGRNLHQRGDVPFRNDNDMHRRHGVNVFKSKNGIIFINFGTGNLSSNNFAKQAIF